MTLKYLGEFPSAPADPGENDAYYDTSSHIYKYYNGASWSAYVPVRVIDDLALSTTYEGSGAPTVASNAVQFPTLDTGTFYLDGATGDVYAYVVPSGWSAW